MGGASSTYRVEYRCVQGFGGGTLEKKPLGRLKGKWEYNIKMDVQEVRYEVMDWIDVDQDRDKWRAFVNAVMNIP